MKKILLFVVLGFLILGLVGCESKNNFKIGKESDVIIEDKDVELLIKEGTLSNTGATLILKNNSNDIISYGNPYEIEIKKDGKWRKINLKLYFTMPLFELDPDEEKELEISWGESYGKLSKGDYRIIKSVSSFYVAAEFSIE